MIPVPGVIVANGPFSYNNRGLLRMPRVPAQEIGLGRGTLELL